MFFFFIVRVHNNIKTLNQELFDKIAFARKLINKINNELKKDYSGQAPSLFVGSYNYPRVRIGLLSAEHYSVNDNPLTWSRRNAQIPEIFESRSRLINASNYGHVKLPDNAKLERIKSLAREAALAAKPIDVDVSLDKKPSLRLSFGSEVLPHGPNVVVNKVLLTSNPRVPRIVEKLYSDDDLKAVSAVKTLWNKGFDEHYISKLLSAGTLGEKIERRFVPTRWGITATDDMVGNYLRKKIFGFPDFGYSLFFGGYLGNYYLLLFFPQQWSFELFEKYVGSRKINLRKNYYTDYEPYNGRKSYSSETAGGYYAARLPVLEFLSNNKKKAGVLALRIITDEYWAPLGVWVVREAVRKSLSSKPFVFSSLDEMLSFAKALLLEKFGFNPEILFSASKLLRIRREQKSLKDYFS